MGYGIRDTSRDVRDDLDYAIDTSLNMDPSQAPRRRSKVKKRRGLAHKPHRKRRNVPQPTRTKGRKIFYARKTGQPYIKLANGRAKFIKGKRHR